MYTRVRQQIVRFSMRDDRTMFLFNFTDENPELPGDLPEQKDEWRLRLSLYALPGLAWPVRVAKARRRFTVRWSFCPKVNIRAVLTQPDP
jgi:hypothetical protein